MPTRPWKLHRPKGTATPSPRLLPNGPCVQVAVPPSAGTPMHTPTRLRRAAALVHHKLEPREGPRPAWRSSGLGCGLSGTPSWYSRAAHLHLGHPAVVAQLHRDDGHAHQLEHVVEELVRPPRLQGWGGVGWSGY